MWLADAADIEDNPTVHQHLQDLVPLSKPNPMMHLDLLSFLVVLVVQPLPMGPEVPENIQENRVQQSCTVLRELPQSTLFTTDRVLS